MGGSVRLIGLLSTAENVKSPPLLKEKIVVAVFSGTNAEIVTSPWRAYAVCAKKLTLEKIARPKTNPKNEIFVKAVSIKY